MSVYIKGYNFSGIAVCLYALYLTIANISTHNENANILLCQSFFLLEIFNIKIRVSNSRLLPTVLQLTSRIFILCVSLHLKYTDYFTVMCIAWYLSDIIRYCYYLSRNKLFKWMRYNFFIVLYPVGVSMELKLVSYLFHYEMWKYVVIAVFLAYIPGFGFLYYHMIKQRSMMRRKRVKKRNIRKERAQ